MCPIRCAKTGNMKRFEGRVAVITGAASGMGAAVARRCADEGMQVVAADIDETGLAELGIDHTVYCDVAKAADMVSLRDEVVERYGAVHFVYLNAGVVIAGPVDELSLEAWEWTLGVDLWGVIHGVRNFLPILRKQDEGHIFATASTCGLQASPGIAPYNVAKFGVVALMETVAHELGPDSNVGVTVLTPGAVNTRIAYSERSMPDEVKAVHQSSAIEDGFLARSRALLAEQGMAPSNVADLVFQAARERRFWIVTHPGWHDVVENRVAGMRANGELRAGFGG